MGPYNRHEIIKDGGKFLLDGKEVKPEELVEILVKEYLVFRKPDYDLGKFCSSCKLNFYFNLWGDLEWCPICGRKLRSKPWRNKNVPRINVEGEP